LHRELHAYDFDRCSVELSNLMVYDLSDSIAVGDWNDCTISPDVTKFYFRRSGGGTLQYDLENSAYTYITNVSTAGQITPNYKQVLLAHRYFTVNDSMVNTICTISAPNKPGLECNYLLNTDTVINIFNLVSPSCFANFRLGKIEGSACDTIVSSVGQVLDKAMYGKLYPNPSQGQLNIEFDSSARRSISIYNMMGQRVYTVSSQEQLVSFNFSSQPLSAGLYMLEAVNEETHTVFKSKFVYEK